MQGMEPGRSVRRALLFRGKRRWDRDRAEGELQLIGDEASAGICPVLGGELEVALAGPIGHHADDVSEVGLGIEVVELAAGDEGEEVGRGGGVVVAAKEEPSL